VHAAVHPPARERVIDESASDRRNREGRRESAAKFAVRFSRGFPRRRSSCRSADPQERSSHVRDARRDIINLAAAMRRPLADRPGSSRDLFTSPAKDQPPHSSALPLSLSLSLSRDTARAGEFYNTPSDPEPLRYPAPLPREPARDCARILIRHRRGDARAFWTIFRLAGTSSHVAAVRDYLWIAYNVAGDAAT